MLEILIPSALLLDFCLTLPFHLLQRSFRFNSSRPFDTSFLSFQHSHPVMYFFLSFQAVHVVTSFHSPQCLCNPFGYMFHCNQPILSVTSFFKFQHSPTLVTSFLSFQLLPSVCCQVVHFVTSVLTFHLVYKPPSLLLPLRFTAYTSYNLFVTLILSSIRCNSFLSFLIYFLPFVSTLPFRSAVPLVSTLNSFLSFVTVFLSFQRSPFIRYFIPFVSTLTARSLLLPFVSSRSLLAVVQEMSYLCDYNKSIQPNYDKIHLSPSAEKHDTDRTKSAGNLVKQWLYTGGKQW